MIFSEKLKLIRKNRGMTQEELAEKLDISRQSIAKWENGLSFPEIYHLISLSNIFNLTIDHLVKDNDVCMTNIVEPPVSDYKFLSEFLVKAKIKTYAGKGHKAESSRPNSHDYRYEEENFLYIDTYIGGECFSGEEAVWEDNTPIFALNYSGRVIGKDFSGNFLKEALKKVPIEKPFRGPQFYQEEDYIYYCKIDGDIIWLQGYEEIYYKNQKIYECYFHGGIVK